MDVRDAVASRFSCRAFLPTPVPLATVRDILSRAARAPSGGNIQPWRVHALAGAPLENLKARIRPHAPKKIRAAKGPNTKYTRSRCGSLLRPPPRSRRGSLSRYRDCARGPAGTLSSIRAQFRILRCAGRVIFLARPHHGAAAMGGPRHVRANRHAAGPRLGAPHLQHRGMDPGTAPCGLSRPTGQSTCCSAAWRSAMPTRLPRSTSGAPRVNRSKISPRLWDSMRRILHKLSRGLKNFAELKQFRKAPITTSV